MSIWRVWFLGAVWLCHYPVSAHTELLKQEIAGRSTVPDKACGHGYLSAVDRSSCICNYGWTGPKCDAFVLPSCTVGGPNPLDGLSCTSSLTRAGRFESLSCKCIVECVDYVMNTVPQIYGNDPFSPNKKMHRLPLPVHPDYLSRCQSLQIKELIRNRQIRESGIKEVKSFHFLPEYATTSFSDCFGNCSDVPNSRCVNHFCECPDDRAGAFCQSPAYGVSPRSPKANDGFLTFQILEVDAFSIAEREVEELYRLRQDHWGPFYFIEQLIRDENNLVVDDEATVVIIPHLHNPGTSVTSWLGYRQSHSGFPKTARPLDDRFFLSLSAGFLANDRWIRPPEFEPRKCMYIQNNVPGGEDKNMQIASPIHDLKFMMDINEFRRKDRPQKDLTELLADLNSLRKERQENYDVSSKNITLFFVGQTKLGSISPPPHPMCVGPSLFTLTKEECTCLNGYSECVRQFVYYNYKDRPDMFLRDVRFDEEELTMEASKEIRSVDPGKLASKMAVSPKMTRSKFCLVAGGAGFDTRIVSSVMTGCIPLWTMLYEVPPLRHVLRHERMIVFVKPHERVQLVNLPALLDCYTDEIRAAITANIDMTWPAFMWGTGTAYHHVLLEIAAITDKLVPSAVEAILKLQGPKYMAEMLAMDFSRYRGLVPGIEEVIYLQEQLEFYDPMVPLLEKAAKCRELV